MKPTSRDRDWFAQFCLQSAANVLDRNGELRFSYVQLSQSLDGCTNGDDSKIDPAVLDLFRNIVQHCNKVKGPTELSDNDEHALLLTLLNIQAAFTMVCGAWKDITINSGTDEYGFEIF